MKMTAKVSWHHHTRQKQQERQPLHLIVPVLFEKLGEIQFYIICFLPFFNFIFCLLILHTRDVSLSAFQLVLLPPTFSVYLILFSHNSMCFVNCR